MRREEQEEDHGKGDKRCPTRLPCRHVFCFLFFEFSVNFSSGRWWNLRGVGKNVVGRFIPSFIVLVTLDPTIE